MSADGSNFNIMTGLGFCSSDPTTGKCLCLRVHNYLFQSKIWAKSIKFINIARIAGNIGIFADITMAIQEIGRQSVKSAIELRESRKLIAYPPVAVEKLNGSNSAQTIWLLNCHGSCFFGHSHDKTTSGIKN